MDEKIKNNMLNHNKFLSKFACLDSQAERFNLINDDFRPSFFRDIDKVIYSLSYTRYIDKTQVYSWVDNDLISKRITHVQLVSKIARTIGRALGLNEDLIEAASLGHDLGHVPFGHMGEKILNDISKKYGEGSFAHNVQSVRLLMDLENSGEGSNVSLQVLDAIFCHNGEKLEKKYSTLKKTKEEFLNEYKNCYFDDSILSKLKPMTLEGCVVRISDIIAYIGKDIEDAERLKKISKENIPSEITGVLGYTNSEIIDTIVRDIIINSFEKPYIKMSEKIYNALQKLIDFNYKYIYLNANSDKRVNECKDKFNKLFRYYLKCLKEKNTDNDIFTLFLNDMNEKYLKNNTNERKVIDYISGMTDDFFDNQYKKYIEKRV